MSARRALLVPGSDLRPGFYAGLAAALAGQGVELRVAALQAQGPPTWAGQLAALEDAWAGAGRPALLIGHSLGGLLALLFAGRAPAGLEALVLLEPAVAPWRWLARRAARAYRRQVVEGQGPRFVNWTGTFRRVADPARFPPAALALYEQTRAELDPAWTAALLEAIPALYPLPFERVRARTLLVRGARSGWRARVGLALLARRLRAPLRTIPGAAHWLANEADPALAAAIAGFADPG